MRKYFWRLRPWTCIGFSLLAMALSLRVGAAPASVTPADRKDWIEARSGHFTYFSSGSEGPVRAIAQDLETLRGVLKMLQRGAGANESRLPEQTYVYVFSDERLFRDYRENAGVAGWFSTRMDGNYIALLTDQEDIQPIVFHEYMHHFIHSHFQNIPSWLDEGLAEVYSTLKVEGQQVLLGGAVAGRFYALQTFKPIPMGEFLEMNNPLHGKGDSIEAARFYAQSWLLTHYLLLGAGSERSHHLQAYIRFLEQGLASKVAFFKAFPIAPELLSQELEGYLKRILFQRMIPVQRLTLKSLDADPSFSSHALAKDQVQARLGMLATLLPNQEALARRHFQAALAIDPGCPLAHLGQGWLSFNAGEPGVAYQHFAQAADRRLDDAALQLMVGEYLHDLALGQNEPDLAGLGKARKYLFQFLKLVPGDSRPLAMLQKSYHVDAAHVPEGIAALTAALQAEPLRWDYQALLGSLYLDQHEPDKALPLLRKVAEGASDEAILQWARKVIVEIEDQGARDGLTEGLRLAREEKYAEAIPVLQQAQAQAKDPDLLRRINSLLTMVQFQLDQARTAAEKKGSGTKGKGRKGH